MDHTSSRADGPDFRVERQLDEDGTVRLVLHGELDIGTEGTLRDALRTAEQTGRPVLVILDHLDYLDSSGLALLLLAHRRAERAGRSFRTTAGNGDVHHVLAITGALALLCPDGA